MPVVDVEPRPPVVGRRNTRDAPPRFFFLAGPPLSGCLTVSATAVGGGGDAGGSGGLGVDMHMVFSQGVVMNSLASWSS